MRILLGVILLAPLLAPAQQGPVRFEATTQLVVVNVSAKTKSGEALEGLKASDFTVTEDGKTQQIRVFEFQRLEDTLLPAPALVTREAAVSSAKPATANSIAPARTGEIKYKDRRLLVLFFDQAGMPVADQLRAQKAALQAQALAHIFTGAVGG